MFEPLLGIETLLWIHLQDQFKKVYEFSSLAQEALLYRSPRSLQWERFQHHLCILGLHAGNVKSSRLAKHVDHQFQHVLRAHALDQRLSETHLSGNTAKRPYV